MNNPPERVINPKMLLIAFLVSGNVKFRTLSMRRGSAMTKLLLTYHPKKHIFDFAKSLLFIDILLPWYANLLTNCSNIWKCSVMVSWKVLHNGDVVSMSSK